MSLKNPGKLRVREETLAVLPEGSSPVRVLHLSDIHMAPWRTAAAEWIQNLSNLGPDVIVGTGDFLGHENGLALLKKALSPFAGLPGVVVHGSNDRTAPIYRNPLSYLRKNPRLTYKKSLTPLDFDGLLELYESLGWNDVENKALRMSLSGTEIEWIGLGDAHHNMDDLVTTSMDVKQSRTRETVTDDSQITSLGLTHAPYQRVLNYLMSWGCKTIFSGHTHGGQICLPGGRALVTNCDLPAKMASGVNNWNHKGNSSLIQVSSGIGTGIYSPLRVFCPPEAILINLI